MKTQTSRILAVFSAVTALSAVAQAQLPLPFTLIRWDGDIAWPGAAPTGSFGRCVAGDFQRDGVRDAFLQAGTKLVFFYDPAVHDGIDTDAIDSAVAINDLAETRSSSGAGSDLLVVSSSGLSRVSWNTGTSAFQVTSISTTGSWPGAVLVRAEDIDQNGIPDIVGVGSDKRTVIVRMNGGATDSTFSLGPTNSNVYDLQFIRWDTAGTYRLCFLDTYGVEILTHGGVRVNRALRPAAFQDAITVVRKSYDGVDVFERVAWARMKPSPSTSQEIVELYRTSAGVQTTSASLTFSAGNHALRLAAADVATETVGEGPLGTDGDEELLVMNQTDYVPSLYRNLSNANGDASFTESPETWQEIDDVSLSPRAMTVTGGSSRPLPLFEDFTGDGSADILVPIELGAESWIQVWRDNHTVYTVEGVTRFTLTPPGPAQDVVLPPTSEPPFPQGGFRMVCDMPRHEDATGVQAIVWRRGSCTVSDGLDPSDEYVLDGNFYFPFHPDTDGPSLLELTMPMNFVLVSGPAVGNCQNDDYWLQLRLTQFSAGTYTQIGANWVAVLTTDACGVTSGTDYYLNDTDPDWVEQRCVRGILGCLGGDCCLGTCGQAQLDVAIYRRRRLPPTYTGGLPGAGTPTTMTTLPL